MATTRKKALALTKGTKARLPSREGIIRKLKDARLMTEAKGRGKNAQRNDLLAAFARLLGSRPAGNRHINRLVVDWTRVVESQYGLGCDLPVESDGKPLFVHVVTAILPPEVSTPAIEAYHALYEG